MTKDFIIGFTRAEEGKVKIVRFDTMKSKGREMPQERDLFIVEVEQRQPPPPTPVVIEPSTLGELRDNEEDDGRHKVHFVGDRISKWLLGDDVREALLATLTALPQDQRLRLIFRVDNTLRETFDSTQLPVELITPEGQDTPYSLSERVAAVIHLVDENANGGPPANSFDWPLRILIVRSNPKDLGLAVPEAEPIRKSILRLGETQFAPGAIVVDVLSSEASINKPATWKAFTDQMKENNDSYNLVIYLGHGSVKTSDGSSCLQFEDGEGHKDVPHFDIISPFQSNQVPVVLLVACLTAEQIAEERFKTLHQRKMSEWLRGSRGVAQALISSWETRTQLVVGMRYRLDVGDATMFLEEFFDSLLRINRGDVEAAVHSARRKLREHSKFPAAFSSPVIFRRLQSESGADELLFRFIAEKEYKPTACQGPVGEWQPIRNVFWNNLVSTGWTTRSEEGKQTYQKLLADVEAVLIQKAIATAPLILPDSVVILPEGSGIFAVKLHGSLGSEKIEKLEGDVLFDRDDIVIGGATTSDELRAKGYRAATDINGRSVHFTIEPANENAQSLENVTLFNITVKVGKEFPLLSPVNLSGIQSTPQRRICPGTNMLIIPPF